MKAIGKKEKSMAKEKLFMHMGINMKEYLKKVREMEKEL